MRLKLFQAAAMVTPPAVIVMIVFRETLGGWGAAVWESYGGPVLVILGVLGFLAVLAASRRLLVPVGYYAADAFGYFFSTVSDRAEIVGSWLRKLAIAVLGSALFASWLAQEGVFTLPAFMAEGFVAKWLEYPRNHPNHVVAYVLVSATVIAVALAVIGGVVALLWQLYALVVGGIGEALAISWTSAWAPHLWSRPPVDSRGGKVLVCQISDLHLSAEGKMPYEIEAGEAAWPEDMPKPTSAELRKRMKRIFKAIAAEEPALVVATGDLTDLGEPEQWLEAEAALSALPPSIGCMLVPGNHDVSINTSEKADTSLEKRHARQARMVEALSLLERGAMRPKLKLRAERWGDIAPGDGARFLPRYFPRCVELPGGDAGAPKVRVIALDSNTYESRFVLSNAVGLIGTDQLDRLDKELSRSSGPVIIALHHHVAHLPGSHGGGARVERDAKEAFLLALDGELLLERLSAYHRRDPARNAVLVLHGHRHLAFLGVYVSPLGGEVLVHAHASSTLGHEVAGRVDGVLRYAAIGLTADNRFFVETREVARAARKRSERARREGLATSE